MASEPLTVDQVVRFVGTVSESYPWDVIVKPYDPEFKEAIVGWETDSITFKSTNIPRIIDLIPVEAPKVETLAQAFGKYERIRPIHYTKPPRIIFYLDMPKHPYRIVLIADVKKGRAIKIILLREKRP